MTTETLWLEYQNQIRGFIRNKINDSETVEDILQNVFIKIHTEITKLKSTEKLKSWLFQITRNTIIDYYRTKKIIEEVPDELADVTSDHSVISDIANSIKFFHFKIR